MTHAEYVARLREALKPFARLAEASFGHRHGMTVMVTVDALRDARAALAIEPPAPEPQVTQQAQTLASAEYGGTTNSKEDPAPDQDCNTTHCKGGCGAPYGEDGWVEAILPNKIWNEVFPEDGAWCFRCITKRLEALGQTNIPILISGTPYVDANETWRRIGFEHGRLVERGLMWSERGQLMPPPPTPSPDVLGAADALADRMAHLIQIEEIDDRYYPDQQAILALAAYRTARNQAQEVKG